MLSLGFWEKLNLEETGKTKERPDLNGSCLKDVEGLFVYLCVLGTHFFGASKFNQFPRLKWRMFRGIWGKTLYLETYS